MGSLTDASDGLVGYPSLVRCAHHVPVREAFVLELESDGAHVGGDVELEPAPTALRRIRWRLAARKD